MQVTWEWKLKLLNGFCQGYVISFLIATLIIGFNVTLPFLFDHDRQLLLKLKALALIICFYTAVNYICIRYTASHSVFKSNSNKINGDAHNQFNNSSDENSQTNLLLKCSSASQYQSNMNGTDERANWAPTADINLGGWVYCKDCFELVPPRAKHCPLCDGCILKRDHHCFFAGCCVGFHNQRYFVIFCLFSALGSIYSSLVTHWYLQNHYEALQTWSVFAYFIPPLIWYWIIGKVTSSVALMCFFLYWSCLTGFICGYYFCVQVFLIVRGQTKYECVKGNHAYKGTVSLNVKSVFGTDWFGRLLFPWPFMDYYGDGKNWDEFLSYKKL